MPQPRSSILCQERLFMIFFLQCIEISYELFFLLTLPKVEMHISPCLRDALSGTKDMYNGLLILPGIVPFVSKLVGKVKHFLGNSICIL